MLASARARERDGGFGESECAMNFTPHDWIENSVRRVRERHHVMLHAELLECDPKARILRVARAEQTQKAFERFIERSRSSRVGPLVDDANARALALVLHEADA